LREWRWDREFVAAHDPLGHEFTVASAVIKARGEADKTQEGVAKAMGTTQAVVARLESGETMPSTSTLSASPRRPVPACGFGLSRRSRASPRRKPADHHMKTSRSRSRRRRKRRKYHPIWSSQGSEASFAPKSCNEKLLFFNGQFLLRKS
jgi:Helix-turn-helix